MLWLYLPGIQNELKRIRRVKTLSGFHLFAQLLGILRMDAQLLCSLCNPMLAFVRSRTG
jgi:hypothetical protein